MCTCELQYFIKIFPLSLSISLLIPVFLHFGTTVISFLTCVYNYFCSLADHFQGPLLERISSSILASESQPSLPYTACLPSLLLFS